MVRGLKFDGSKHQGRHEVAPNRYLGNRPKGRGKLVHCTNPGDSGDLAAGCAGGILRTALRMGER